MPPWGHWTTKRTKLLPRNQISLHPGEGGDHPPNTSVPRGVGHCLRTVSAFQESQFPSLSGAEAIASCLVGTWIVLEF